MPLVEIGSDPYERALKGVVLGPDQKPLQGAKVVCEVVRTPGAGLIQTSLDMRQVITDAQGRFSLYLPDANQRNERGRLIPLRSDYHVTVTAPSGDLFPCAGVFPNTAEAVIRLQRPELFHKFEFETPGGGRAGAQDLSTLSITYEPAGGGRVGLDTASLRDGGKLLPGRYTATRLPVGDGDRITFLPVDVTPESPETLLFRLPPAVEYRGRVVDGPTGKPLRGAFVIGMVAITANNLATLTDEEWRRLEALPASPPLDAEPLAAVDRVYSFKGVVRTDENGEYRLPQPVDRNYYSLVTFARDRLPYSLRVLKPVDQRQPLVTAPDLPLFLAAKVVVKPVVETGHLAVMPRWAVAEDGQPEWFGRFKAGLRDPASKAQFDCEQWLKLDAAGAIYVPADIKLTLRFELPYNDEWVARSYEKPFQLPAGKTLDIGDLTFVPALAVTVRVVDEAGRPLEGAPVRRMYNGKNVWSVAHNADEKGIAHFHILPGSSGQFGVTDGIPRADLNGPDAPRAGFDVGATAPDGPFTITLTAQQVRALTASTRPKP